VRPRKREYRYVSQTQFRRRRLRNLWGDSSGRIRRECLRILPLGKTVASAPDFFPRNRDQTETADRPTAFSVIQSRKLPAPHRAVQTRRDAAPPASRALRVVGNPEAKVSRLHLGVGYATPSINSPDVDVVVSGEQQESDGFLDSPAYVLDAMTLGIPKGWIMLGHNISEEQGMQEMAQWN